MKGWGMPAKLGAQEDVGEGTVSCNLNEVVTKGAEGSDKIWVVLVKGIVLWNVHQEVVFNVFVLGGPNLLSLFVDDGVLVWVMVSGGAGQGSEELWEELSFGEDEEWKGMAGRSRRGRRWGSGNRSGDNRQREVLNWDVCKRDSLNDFLETLVDVDVLGLRVRILELGTNNVVLLGGNVGENLKEIGWGDSKGGGDWSDGDNRRWIDNKGG